MTETFLTASDPGVLGWFESYEGRLLMQLCATLPQGSQAVELGSFCGKSSRWMFAGCVLSGAKLTCIDLFTGRVPNEEHWAGMKEDIFAHVFQDNLVPVFNTNIMAAFGPEAVKELWVHKEDSIKAAQKWSRPLVDLIFIDDDHVNCRSVTNAWIPRMADHGMMLFHDVHPVKTYGPDGPINTVQTMIRKEGWFLNVNQGLIVGLSRDPQWWNTRLEAFSDEYGNTPRPIAGGESSNTNGVGTSDSPGSYHEHARPSYPDRGA